MNLHLRHSQLTEAQSSSMLSSTAPGEQMHRDSAIAAPDGSLIEAQWRDAELALAMLIMSKGPSAVRLKGRHGPARDVWLAKLAEMADQHDVAVHRISSAAPTSQFLPSLDLAATLDAGRPVETEGMIQRAAGGILIVSAAERLGAEPAALLAQALDGHKLRVLALDESLEEDEAHMPAALASRMQITAKTDGVPLAICSVPSEILDQHCNRADIPADLQLSLANALDGLGRPSPTILLHCCTTARALARLAGERTVQPTHAHHALQLVLGVTLTTPPPPEEKEDLQEELEQQRPPEQSDQQDEQPAQQDTSQAETQSEGLAEDMTVETEHGAALDPAILTAMAAQLAGRQADTSANASSGAGAKRRNTRRGRPAGHSENAPYPDARPDILATLRTAAPWQRIRKRNSADETGGRVLIRSSDFRYRRLHQPRETVTIFIVDASGSTATQRLGEAKGAIERLLADCYVRRDNVALIAFRGREAEVLLEPTRSLVRAKKGLSALPGGGATPLASGLDQGARMALRARREGQTPLMVLMSDGSANIGLDGEPGRARANADAVKVAQQIRAHGLSCLFVDTARRPKPQTYALSVALGAELIPLPASNAAGLVKIISNRLNPA